jgi:flagellar biosynthesis protein FliR
VSPVDAALCAAARVAPAVALAPLAGGRSWTARAIVAAILTAAVVPAVAAAPAPSLLAVAVARELLAGLALGLVAAVPFAAAEAGGGLLDGARAPTVGARATTLADAYALLALALFCALSGPRLVLAGVVESYAALPVGAAVPGGARVAIEAGARLVAAGITVAAPALAALLVAELVAGLVLRAQPALEDVLALPSLRTVIVVAMAALTLTTAIRVVGSPSRLSPSRLSEELREAARALGTP